MLKHALDAQLELHDWSGQKTLSQAAKYDRKVGGRFTAPACHESTRSTPPKSIITLTLVTDRPSIRVPVSI